jgi:hypothetical protein
MRQCHWTIICEDTRNPMHPSDGPLEPSRPWAAARLASRVTGPLFLIPLGTIAGCDHFLIVRLHFSANSPSSTIPQPVTSYKTHPDYPPHTRNHTTSPLPWRKRSNTISTAPDGRRPTCLAYARTACPTTHTCRCSRKIMAPSARYAADHTQFSDGRQIGPLGRSAQTSV